MPDATSTYDERQYQLMLALLEQYARKQIGLDRLITGLEGLLGHLEHAPDTWKQSFLRQWGVLEDVYAVALDRNANQLEQNDIRLIADALTELRGLVLLALKQRVSITEGGK